MANLAPMFQILGTDGALVGGDPGVPIKEVQELYRLMVLAREFDRRALSLQRQGRLGTYAMLEGQEAAQVGSAMALGPTDFAYPSYREHAVELARGIPVEVILSYWRGLPNTDWDVLRHRCGIVCVPIGSHIPHAVGHAYATRLRGEDTVTIAYFGDGATSENDFHSGLNFAGVWRTPTVFFCQNNFYAISVPYSKQTASETIAQKADAYGIHGMRVDGMDPLAVYLATQEAVRRARDGEGPTLIEAVCYRYGAHATADDARLYRDAEEEAEWREKDPIDRLRRYLEGTGEWSEELDGAVRTEAAQSVTAAIEAIEERPLPGTRRGDPPRLRPHSGGTGRATARGATKPGRGGDRVRRRWRSGRSATTRSPTVPPSAGRWRRRSTPPRARRWSGTTRWSYWARTSRLAGGVFRITEGLLAEFGEDRVIDTPLNESGIVGTAIGMAVAGARPVPEIQFDGFVYPAFDQIVSHLGRTRYRIERQPLAPGGRPLPQRRRDRRPRTPLRQSRGLLRPRPRVGGGLPLLADRRQGAARRRSRRRRPGDLPRAQGPLPSGSGGRPHRALHLADRESADPPSR